MDWQVEYYKKENGKIPVLEYLLTLNPKIRAKAFSEIELLEKHGTDLREPYTKPIKGEKYKELYQEEKCCHYLVYENDSVIACGGAVIKEDVPFCFFKTPMYGYIIDVYKCGNNGQNGMVKKLNFNINFKEDVTYDIF